jgi:hypothetical protein
VNFHRVGPFDQDRDYDQPRGNEGDDRM